MLEREKVDRWQEVIIHTHYWMLWIMKANNIFITSFLRLLFLDDTLPRPFPNCSVPTPMCSSSRGNVSTVICNWGKRNKRKNHLNEYLHKPAKESSFFKEKIWFIHNRETRLPKEQFVSIFSCHVCSGGKSLWFSMVVNPFQIYGFNMDFVSP